MSNMMKSVDESSTISN